VFGDRETEPERIQVLALSVIHPENGAVPVLGEKL